MKVDGEFTIRDATNKIRAKGAVEVVTVAMKYAPVEKK